MDVELLLPLPPPLLQSPSVFGQSPNYPEKEEKNCEKIFHFLSFLIAY